MNVAASRARDQLWCVRSVALDDLHPDDVRNQFIRHCQNPGWVDQATAEAEANDKPGCGAEAVRDDNVEIGRKTKGEQQQGHCGKTSSDRKEPRACSSLLDQTVLQRWGDQKADGDCHDCKGSNV